MNVLPPLRRRAILFAGLGLLAIWGASLYLMNRAEREAVRASEDQARLMARAFAEHTNSTARLIDNILIDLAHTWARDPAEFADEINRYHLNTTGLALQMGVIDRDGWVVYTDIPMPAKRVNLADREHVRVHLDSNADRLFISRPVQGRVSGKWSIQFSRPIRKNGRTEGVVVFAADPEFFNRFYMSLNLANQDVVVMIRDSGDILARFPGGESYLGRVLAGTPPLAPGAPIQGIFRAVARTDGVERLYAYYRLPEYGLILEAGFTVDNLLAPYYRQRIWIIAAAFALSLALLFAAWVVLRQMVERERRAVELRESNSRLEERVQHRTRELNRALAEMETFSYSVAHDLKAPLRAIISFSALVAADYAAGLAAEGHAMLERVKAAALRMNELLDGLLALAQLSRQELHLEQLDLGRLAREIAGMLAAEDPGRQVRVTIGDNLLARADARLMRVALCNLLENAWKFTAGVPEPAVEFGRGGPPGGFVVSDNGAGFDMAYASRLFVPFGRLHNNNEFEGTGIGLATTQRIIERLGGRIWAESSPGQGASFYFVLSEHGPAPG
jgi:signal transduction histidine kinase